MKILDCNLNFGATNNGQPYKNCDTFEELTAELDRCGIDGGLIRCTYSDTVGVNYGNNFAAEKIRESGNLNYYGVWAVLPPFTGETPGGAELFRSMKENRIGAVYINPATHRYVPSLLTLGRLFNDLSERKIPVILNTDRNVSMELIYKILAAFPDLTAIVGDSDCWPNARKLYPLAYSYKNVRLDLSYVMDAGGIEDMTSRFGAEKLLFGSAFPNRYTGSMLAVTRSADISEEEREMIFSGNLLKMLREAEFDD
ncbi:MAG: amidohydrolase [Clostridia bacterium]|nr:amidohydrolase [Clostridia bacterium]